MSDLKDLKKFKGIDIDIYNGNKSIIASVELSEVKEMDFGEGNQNTRQVIVKSSILNDDEKQPITATEYISLKLVDGEWGYSDSPKSKAQKMLTYFKVNDFESLVDKQIIINKKIKENGKAFLGFSYGN